MALTQIDFDAKEEDKIKHFSKIWKTNKPSTIKRIIDKFEEED